MKQKGKIVKAAVAMPALACKMFLDTENETFYAYPYDIDDPSVSRSLGTVSGRQVLQFTAAAAPSKGWIIITGTPSAQLFQSAREFLTKGNPIRIVHGLDTPGRALRFRRLRADTAGALWIHSDPHNATKRRHQRKDSASYPKHNPRCPQE